LGHSAYQALDKHRIILGLRESQLPHLFGLVAASKCSGSEASQSAEPYVNRQKQLPVLMIPADPKGWESAVEELANILVPGIEKMMTC
jgi:hypothetical protein